MRGMQAAWLRRAHPELAERWVQRGSGSRRLSPSVPSSSEESQAPGVARLPRVAGERRDFGMLAPSGKARHSISRAASEQDAMLEGPVQAAPGARGGLLGLRDEQDGFARRDSGRAMRKRV
jgi:hypothetical protein